MNPYTQKYPKVPILKSTHKVPIYPEVPKGTQKYPYPQVPTSKGSYQGFIPRVHTRGWCQCNISISTLSSSSVGYTQEELGAGAARDSASIPPPLFLIFCINLISDIFEVSISAAGPPSSSSSSCLLLKLIILYLYISGHI